ncbi:MAG: arabinofuranan 3-O-arabinosyltransferase, partial [Ilumatobacteraceae bacterium]
MMRDNAGEKESSPSVRPVIIGILALCLLLFVTAQPGWFAADNRFIQFWNPTKALREARRTWATQTNMGLIPSARGLGLYLFSALLQKLGTPVWLIERLLHGVLVAAGAIGTVLVTKEFVPRSRVAHAVAGIWWIASPFTAAFLVPSGLYIYAAMCPWLVLAVLRGSTSTSRWRWAAVLALAVACGGLTNLPTLVLVSLPLIPVSIYLVTTGQTTARNLIRFLLRAAALIASVLAFEIYRATLVSSYFAQNLATSETAEGVSGSSSWSESLRGLGHWLAYWNPTGPLSEPSLTSYFTAPLMIVATFVPVVVVVALAAFSKRRVVALMTCVLLLSSTVMVAAFPVDAPSPFGRALWWLYDTVPATFALRNTFKAGAGLLLATCVLLAVAATLAAKRWHGDALRRRAAVAIAALVVIASASPLWTAAVYKNPGRTKNIPSYWTDAMRWLDSEPGSSRVLIAPGDVDDYRWGGALNGDLFSTFLSRPFVLYRPPQKSLSTGPADTENLIESLNTELSLGTYQPGSIGPIAHRMGIGYVLIRNDLRWEGTAVARPALFDPLRSDPALVLEASFGHDGENVVASSDGSTAALREHELPPVEIYRVRGDNEPARALSGPSLLVSGDGAAWPGLARGGALDHFGPIRYTARLSAVDAKDELAAGAPLFITDSNRRRVPQIGGLPSPTLTASDDHGADLFGRAGSQSVVTYADATDIRFLGQTALFGSGPENRAAAAFDGDPSTMFTAGALNDLSANDVLRVDLKQPKAISEVSIDATNSPGRRVVRAEMSFPDGSSVPIDLATGRATVSFPTRTVQGFDIRPTALAGRGPGALGLTPWGIREITIPGLDLAEVIQMPDDVMRLSRLEPTLDSLLAVVPVSYLFERLTPDVEGAMRRSFRVPSDRQLTGAGTAQLRRSAPGAVVASALGVPVGANSESRLNENSSGALAADGDLTTAWQVPVGFPAVLSVDVPRQTISGVQISVDL